MTPYLLPITKSFDTKKPASKHNAGSLAVIPATCRAVALAKAEGRNPAFLPFLFPILVNYPKLPAPLNLSFMFNWGFDRK